LLGGVTAEHGFGGGERVTSDKRIYPPSVGIRASLSTAAWRCVRLVHGAGAGGPAEKAEMGNWGRARGTYGWEGRSQFGCMFIFVRVGTGFLGLRRSDQHISGGGGGVPLGIGGRQTPHDALDGGGTIPAGVVRSLLRKRRAD